MIVGHREQAAPLLFKPLTALARQAPWTVAVAAGTGCPMLLLAVRALKNVRSQLACAAAGQSAQQLKRSSAKPQGRLECGQEAAQDAPQCVQRSIPRRRGGTEPVHGNERGGSGQEPGYGATRLRSMRSSGEPTWP